MVESSGTGFGGELFDVNNRTTMDEEEHLWHQRNETLVLVDDFRFEKTSSTVTESILQFVENELSTGIQCIFSVGSSAAAILLVYVLLKRNSKLRTLPGTIYLLHVAFCSIFSLGIYRPVSFLLEHTLLENLVYNFQYICVDNHFSTFLDGVNLYLALAMIIYHYFHHHKPEISQNFQRISIILVYTTALIELAWNISECFTNHTVASNWFLVFYCFLVTVVIAIDTVCKPRTTKHLAYTAKMIIFCFLPVVIMSRLLYYSFFFFEYVPLFLSAILEILYYLSEFLVYAMPMLLVAFLYRNHEDFRGAFKSVVYSRSSKEQLEDSDEGVIITEDENGTQEVDLGV